MELNGGIENGEIQIPYNVGLAPLPGVTLALEGQWTESKWDTWNLVQGMCGSVELSKKVIFSGHLNLFERDLDQGNDPDAMANWRGNPNPQLELRAMLGGIIPGIDLAAKCKYPFLGKSPIGGITTEGLNERTLSKTSVSLGANITLPYGKTSMKLLGEVSTVDTAIPQPQESCDDIIIVLFLERRLSVWSVSCAGCGC